LLAHISPAQENMWTDVEALPGSSPKPVDRDLDDDRIERLRDAIERNARVSTREDPLQVSGDIVNTRPSGTKPR